MSIEGHTFSGCESLTSVVIPNSVTKIEEYAFLDCASLASITIPDEVTSIGDYAFDGCYSLTSISIPESVTSIGISAFWGCRSLTSVNLPERITKIPDFAFAGCWRLASIEIPKSVTSIGFQAFHYCNDLTSVTIPNSVITIDKDAFSGCSGLTSVTIPASVTSIGDFAFYDYGQCGNLTSVTNRSKIPQYVDYYAFSVHDELHVPVGCKEIYSNSIGWSSFEKIIDDVVLDDEEEALTATNLIEAIGNVEFTDACKSKIEAARKAYDALSKEQQALVLNYDLLIEAEEAYKLLEGTGIANLNSDDSPKDGKYFEKGKVVIVKNGKKFNINGLAE